MEFGVQSSECNFEKKFYNYSTLNNMLYRKQQCIAIRYSKCEQDKYIIIFKVISLIAKECWWAEFSQRIRQTISE